ncbi:MAG: acyl-CoA dehydrogenase [Gammaproteobacteria bacterium]|nr:acyl-CoA dehydrogenase [Gammaproteobacteria bacterium]NIM74616.1 acyl-CoA dehydrogenase [Gammaproteobacteria bacterium]NIO26449.1 acyl-CoA dehydrogenase [Gammaproteobacteria bacterium]NIO67001.1 acyl-CoA dehydrogenase [Gammaproteobacteria bacterium]NIP46800.1 acyl-CoA dehydrogenase [Gammaproteobacteria bacterium]
MAIYRAPIRDMQFVIHELLDAQSCFAELPGGEEASADIIDSILEEGAKLCESIVFPTNRTGDVEGCRLDDGQVRTPSGFKEAYEALCTGGWMGLACDPEYGGQGLPHTLSVFFEEMLQSSNMSLALYPGLTRGAYVAIRAHGSDEMKRTYLPKLVDGSWTGVMCLTESHAGTDLGMLRTRAVPDGDGSYRVSGTKIFISGGDQDLTENIVHLVLARLPDAPEGVKGISMFLVPKYLVNADGSLGERNTFSCGSIEHKMGIKGASTCVMNYENAVGYLIGEPHKGLQAMFSMMNHERLMVGQEGLSQAEVAYQSAADYARERIQGRALSGVKSPDQPADPIIVHPDVRRMLLTGKACNEAARALLGWVSLQVDIAERHPDAGMREHAEDLVALFTPVIKAYFTDYGNEVCNLSMQVFGGHGYISEWGMEQLVRDSRVAQIYEGANGIHALDLAGRKLSMHEGRLIKRYLKILEDFVAEHRQDKKLDEFIAPLSGAVAALEDATRWLAKARMEDPDEIGAASYDYLRLMALVSFGYMWARSAAIATGKVEGDNTGFYQAKLTTARFFMKRLLPQTTALVATLRAGSRSLMELPAESF